MKCSRQKYLCYSCAFLRCLLFSFALALQNCCPVAQALEQQKEINTKYQIQFVGVDQQDREAILLAQKNSTLYANKSKGFENFITLLSRAREDYKSILGAFYTQGYYGPLISITINGQEAKELPFLNAVTSAPHIIVTVHAGAKYHFAKAEVSALSYDGKKQKEHLQEVRNLGYAVGHVAQSSLILQLENLGLKIWRQQGYAAVKLKKYTVIANHKTHTVEANIVFTPGPKAYYGKVTIKNNSPSPFVDPAFLAFMAYLPEGKLYDPADLEDLQNRLIKLNIFQSVSLHEEKLQKGNKVPMTLFVQESKRYHIGISGNYAIPEGLGLEATWQARNLFHHAEQLSLQARLDNLSPNFLLHKKPHTTSNGFSSLIGGSYTCPGVFTPNTNFLTQFSVQKEVLNNYTTKNATLEIGYTNSFSRKLSGEAFVGFRIIQTNDDYFGSRCFRTIGLKTSLLYDNRDNAANPKSGVYGFIQLQPFYEQKHQKFSNQLIAEGRGYLILDKRKRFIFAQRIKIGSITGASIKFLPSNFLFFAGGGGSIRGYGYKSIGIKTPNGETIGGRSSIESSTELRSFLTPKIGVVAFVDAGFVKDTAWPKLHGKPKIGWGLGGRYLTSLGPIRLDIALPVRRETGAPKFGIYLGLGQAF